MFFIFWSAEDSVILWNELFLQSSFIFGQFVKKFFLFLLWYRFDLFWLHILFFQLFNYFLALHRLNCLTVNVFQLTHLSSLRNVHVHRTAVLYHHCYLNCVIWYHPSRSPSKLRKVWCCNWVLWQACCLLLLKLPFWLASEWMPEWFQLIEFPCELHEIAVHQFQMQISSFWHSTLGPNVWWDRLP